MYDLWDFHPTGTNMWCPVFHPHLSIRVELLVVRLDHFVGTILHGLCFCPLSCKGLQDFESASLLNTNFVISWCWGSLAILQSIDNGLEIRESRNRNVPLSAWLVDLVAQTIQHFPTRISQGQSSTNCGARILDFLQGWIMIVKDCSNIWPKFLDVAFLQKMNIVLKGGQRRRCVVSM